MRRIFFLGWFSHVSNSFFNISFQCSEPKKNYSFAYIWCFRIRVIIIFRICIFKKNSNPDPQHCFFFSVSLTLISFPQGIGGFLPGQLPTWVYPRGETQVWEWSTDRFFMDRDTDSTLQKIRVRIRPLRKSGPRWTSKRRDPTDLQCLEYESGSKPLNKKKSDRIPRGGTEVDANTLRTFSVQNLNLDPSH